MGDYGEPFASVLARQALEALDWNWGDAYEITEKDGLWRAVRRDGLGGALEAASAEDLRDLIMDDYMTRPVPREPLG